MADTISFKCPACGGKTLSITSQPKSYAELAGAVCTDCGHVFTEDDFKEFFRRLALKACAETFQHRRF